MYDCIDRHRCDMNIYTFGLRFGYVSFHSFVSYTYVSLIHINRPFLLCVWYVNVTPHHTLGANQHRSRYTQPPSPFIPKRMIPPYIPIIFFFQQLGYKKEKLDPATYAYLMEWYTGQLKLRKPAPEKWAPDNTYLNHWEVATTMTKASKKVQEVCMYVTRSQVIHIIDHFVSFPLVCACNWYFSFFRLYHTV